jgi:alpha-D-ribose 1-methylphosphonate 5-triphosphate diphosphatase PhnM
MYSKSKDLQGDAHIWASDDGEYIAVNGSLDVLNGPYSRDSLVTASFYLNRERAERLYKELGRAIDEMIQNKEEGGEK